jgi:hypothetical protein
MPSKPDPSAQARAWNQFEHNRYSSKLSAAKTEIDKKYHLPVKTWGVGNPFAKIMSVHIERAKEWAEKVHELCNEVWEEQGKARTPAFLWGVVHVYIQRAIRASVGSATDEMKQWAVRTNRSDGLGAVQQALAIETSRLKGEWRNRIEIEARELELEQARLASRTSHPGAVHASAGQVAPAQESSKSKRAKRRSKSKASRDSDPDIIKRRAIVKQNRNLTAQGICRLFDEAHIPLPKSIREAGSWSKAFKTPQWRHSIESLISRDRKATST